jgi:putative ABC transport system substrate-binding protein
VKRRQLVLLAAGATLAWPLRLVAQSSDQVRRIGILMGVAEDSRDGQARIAAFREGLRAAGWREGGNLQVDLRWADGDMGRIRALAADMVATAPAAILANGTSAVTALKELTRTIPIVFAQIQDPVGLVVASLARPGGNITGFAVTMDFDLIGK